MTYSADMEEDMYSNHPNVSGITIPCIVRGSSASVMSSVGFSTTNIHYKISPKAKVIGKVCMGILEPQEGTELQESLAVLAFFKDAYKAEIMMADSSGTK